MFTYDNVVLVIVLLPVIVNVVEVIVALFVKFNVALLFMIILLQETFVLKV